MDALTSTASSTMAGSPAVAPLRRTQLFALPEMRWAAASLVLFLLALAGQLPGGPWWLWAPLYVACYLAGGWEPLLAGLRELRERRLDVDLLMVAAALGAAAIGQVLDGGLLIVIFATSGALEALATARTEDSVRALLDLAPETTTRIEPGDTEREVPVADLVVGDVTLVRPGERVGADGSVLAGSSEVDQATITGEPMPVGKNVGDEVFAGTLNGTGVLQVRVDRPAAESVVARIASLVEEASRTKARTQLFIDKVEQRYSVGMVGATVLLFAVPLLLGHALQPTLLRAMTFMIVASPCAVVLATMPPLLAAIANAGRHGVLVKSAVVMEQLGTTTTVAFDKTGTLTRGTPQVASIHAVPAAETTESSETSRTAVLTLAASAEHPSEHPLGAAIVRAARGRGLALRPAEDFSATPGQGVEARVDGHQVRVGTPDALAPGSGTSAPFTGARATAADLQGAGHTAVVVTVDRVPVGVLAIVDEVRAEAAATVEALTALTGNTPVLLTGDNPTAAAKLAALVGIDDVRAGLLPHDKVTAVRDLHESGQKVAVVGDGINDAPALAAADSGIAMGGAGSDLTLQTADAVVVRDDLTTIPAVIALSRRARRVVTANLVVAACFILGLVVWDIAGHLPLPLGVAGHEGSTVIVGLNGLRLLRASAWPTERGHLRRASGG
ncbi:MAG: heavy metal translocating P-type ATPase [Marmoricola sp.]